MCLGGWGRLELGHTVILSVALLDFATQNRKERLAKNLFKSMEILH